MPRAAKKPCRQSGCSALVDNGYCDKHRKAVFVAQKQVATIDYKERNRFYQRKVWKDARALHLQDEPMCRSCRNAGLLVIATHVDHIVSIEIGGDQYDQNNLQSMCKSCHEAKTRRDEHRRRTSDR